EKLAEEKEEQIYTYKVQNRPAAELAAILQKVLATEAQQPGTASPAGVAPRFEPVTVASPAPSGRTSTGLGAATSTGPGVGTGATGGVVRTVQSPTMQTRPASDAGSAGAAAYRAGGAKVVVDEQKQALVIQTTPTEYQRVQRILRHLDLPGTQV